VSPAERGGHDAPRAPGASGPPGAPGAAAARSPPGSPAAVRALRVVVTGRVQGVWFRQSTAETARAAGVVGWVRNLPDGRVEAWLQGAEEPVERVLAWIRRGGPPAAQVDAVDVHADASADPDLAGFVVRR